MINMILGAKSLGLGIPPRGTSASVQSDFASCTVGRVEGKVWHACKVHRLECGQVGLSLVRCIRGHVHDAGVCTGSFEAR